MLPLKANMKNYQTDSRCSACGLSDENQLHLMQCQVLNQYDHKNTHDTDHKKIYSSDIKKSRIRETLNLSTDADHRTDIIIFFWLSG